MNFYKDLAAAKIPVAVDIDNVVVAQSKVLHGGLGDQVCRIHWSEWVVINTGSVLCSLVRTVDMFTLMRIACASL
jgi:hypothetical protein